MLTSRSTNFSLVMLFFSASGTREIIFKNDGVIASSNFAAIRSEMMVKEKTSFLGKLWKPIANRYLSKIMQAENSVSTLYFFRVCNSKIFYIAKLLSLTKISDFS